MTSRHLKKKKNRRLPQRVERVRRVRVGVRGLARCFGIRAVYPPRVYLQVFMMAALTLAFYGA